MIIMKKEVTLFIHDLFHEHSVHKNILVGTREKITNINFMCRIKMENWIFFNPVPCNDKKHERNTRT